MTGERCGEMSRCLAATRDFSVGGYPRPVGIGRDRDQILQVINGGEWTTAPVAGSPTFAGSWARFAATFGGSQRALFS